MSTQYKTPTPINEPVLSYAPNTPERAQLLSTIQSLRNDSKNIGFYINNQACFTDNTQRISPPHDHGHTLGQYHLGDATHVQQAIDSALRARKQWSNTTLGERSRIFLKAAELLRTKYRAQINATTMLAQSKNVFQAEVDAACEFIDFLNFNVRFAEQIEQTQPLSTQGVWNQLEYRPLEGFVAAITPFNFTSIAGNLACAPALMGNTVVWKPSFTQIYSAQITIEVLIEAGLPPGVINVVYADPEVFSKVVFAHPEFAGLHFTGSSQVFKNLWQTIGTQLGTYRNYPRIVGETGGKDFILAHADCNEDALITAIIRGAFEYQGQKCSAASRGYIAQSTWNNIQERLLEQIATLTVGGVENFGNFVNAVITEQAFDRITNYLTRAKASNEVTILAGGNADKSQGYFIEPTLLTTTNPQYEIMENELFGPVFCIYVYPDKDYDQVLKLVDNTSPYALTGSVFANNQAVITQTLQALRYAAGNFYINDKPTGAVVAQQPFGGARASGTNDKAGLHFNLLRWSSPRTIKETFVPPTDYTYPFLQ